MPRSRELSNPPPAHRARQTGGNGAPKPDTDPVARLERVVEDMQRTLDIQFPRMADMQGRHRRVTCQPARRVDERLARTPFAAVCPVCHCTAVTVHEDHKLSTTFRCSGCGILFVVAPPPRPDEH